MIAMLRTTMGKVNSMQEQVDNVIGEVETLRKNNNKNMPEKQANKYTLTNEGCHSWTY